MKATWISCNAVRFDDGTCWSRIGTCGTHEMDLEWRLRYHATARQRELDVLSAASVVSAYRSLAAATHRRIVEVVMALRDVEAALEEGRATCVECKKRNSGTVS